MGGGVKNNLEGDKNSLRGQKIFRGTKNFFRGVKLRKKGGCAKKGRQKFWDMSQKKFRGGGKFKIRPWRQAP